MKHRALSMLLALVMVVSLLPIAAIANGAEENTAAEERKETVEMRENDSQQGGDCDVTRSVSKTTEIERRGGKRWDKPKKAEKSRDCGGGKF